MSASISFSCGCSEKAVCRSTLCAGDKFSDALSNPSSDFLLAPQPLSNTESL